MDNTKHGGTSETDVNTEEIVYKTAENHNNTAEEVQRTEENDSTGQRQDKVGAQGEVEEPIIDELGVRIEQPQVWLRRVPMAGKTQKGNKVATKVADMLKNQITTEGIPERVPKAGDTIQ